MDYKDTLLMPKTAFKMRGGLINKEPEFQKKWEKMNLYQQKLDQNKGNTPFVLHDGPPYANGDLHMGHALNKILKDFIVRYKHMRGFYANYVPGWDTHGLPIEQALTKKGVNRKELSVKEFREMCAEFADSQIDLQRAGFKRMGIDGKWEDPYITYLPKYEAAQVRVLKEMAEKGLIYRGKKPIYWSPVSESSLAEAELEYQDKQSPSIYVAFETTDGKGVVDNGVKFVIWTTTPWTIPSNLGLSVHPNLNYVQFNYEGNEYIVVEDLLDQFCEAVEFDKEKVTRTKEFKGESLEYIQTAHPLIDRTSMVILGEHVTTDTGTGVVHTAPGHGEDDFIVGQKYDLGVLSPVDHKGVFTDEAGKYEGLFYDDANKEITKDLEESGALLKLNFIKHSYPHDWRTKTPVIFRATPQWFASIKNVREDILDRLDEVDFKVEWNRTRMKNMISNRGDWVISRQRVWGVPLPFFYAEDGTEIVDVNVIEHVASLFETHGSNIWFDWDTKDLLPQGYSHSGSPNGEFTREMDIMDVWFDSGSSHRGVLSTREDLDFPADLYIEGSDQYRGWFNSSLITSVSTQGVSPYKGLLSHGFVLDGQGKKMSKSLGNVILPSKVMNQMGADIIRLWVMSSDYEEDVRISEDILKQVSEVYRKLRNTFRFLLGNVNDFDIREDAIRYDELKEVDQFMYNRFVELKNLMITSYDNYDYMTMYQSLQNFINVELSNFYLDYGKDILYIEQNDSHIRRSMQTVLYKILTEMNVLLAPVLVHTAEEIYEHTPGSDKDSVHLETMPESEKVDEALLDKWKYFMAVRDDVLKALEVARNSKVIGKSLEAKVIVTEPQSLSFAELNSALEQLFIVSQVKIVDDLDESYLYKHIHVKVEHADGAQCERCWNYSIDESLVNGETDVCPRCQSVLGR